MPLRYRPRLNLTEREIRDAMKYTTSNKDAARYLGVSYSAYQKYAKLYRDEQTDKTLYELHKNKSGKGTHKRSVGATKYSGLQALHEILQGKHPQYRGNLKARLIKEGILAEQCNICGFEERRITDDTVPLILAYKDGDKTNHHIDNLEFTCYNCFYLCIGSVFNKSNAAVKPDFGGY